MTKKDYIIIAHALKDIRNYTTSSDWFSPKDLEAVRHYEAQLIIRLGQYMLADNKRFKYQEFTKLLQ